MLGAWVVRFLAYSALIVSAAIVLVLADVAAWWAILLVIERRVGSSARARPRIG